MNLNSVKKPIEPTVFRISSMLFGDLIRSLSVTWSDSFINSNKNLYFSRISFIFELLIFLTWANLTMIPIKFVVNTNSVMNSDEILYTEMRPWNRRTQKCPLKILLRLIWMEHLVGIIPYKHFWGTFFNAIISRDAFPCSSYRARIYSSRFI